MITVTCIDPRGAMAIRIYREERLTVRKRGGRKRAIGTRAPLEVPQVRSRVSAAMVSAIRRRDTRPSKMFRPDDADIGHRDDSDLARNKCE